MQETKQTIPVTLIAFVLMYSKINAYVGTNNLNFIAQLLCTTKSYSFQNTIYEFKKINLTLNILLFFDTIK